MVTLIIQNTFEPYYAGRESFSAPASDPVVEAAEADELRKRLLTRKRRVELLQARLAAMKPASATR